jgi:ferredoxin
MLEHHPETARRLSQKEALELLESEYRRGHLHSAWFKDAMLGRMYTICNCCSCCCAGIEMMVKHGVPVVAPSGYTARVAPELCRGCGICQEACPFGLIRMDGVAAVDVERCMGCGVCVGQCTSEALSLVRDPRRGEPLDVSALLRDAETEQDGRAE